MICFLHAVIREAEHGEQYICESSKILSEWKIKHYDATCLSIDVDGDIL